MSSLDANLIIKKIRTQTQSPLAILSHSHVGVTIFHLPYFPYSPFECITTIPSPPQDFAVATLIFGLKWAPLSL